MYNINQFLQHTNYIVLSGGGSRGITALSFLNNLFRHVEKITNKSITQWINKRLKGCAGTSVGSIIAFSLCCGIDPYDTLIYIRENMQMFNIDHHTKLKGIYKRSFIQNILTTNYRYTNQISIEYLYDIVKNMMTCLCGIDTSVTMEQLYEITKTNLVVNAFDLVTMSEIQFSHKTTPDFLVLDAIVCSCCIPTIFEPCGVQYKQHCWVLVDGGYRNNMMISPFDISKTLSICLNTHIFNNQEIICRGFCPEIGKQIMQTCKKKHRPDYTMFHIRNPFSTYYQYMSFILSEHFYYYKDMYYLKYIPEQQLKNTVFLTNVSDHSISIYNNKSVKWIQQIKNAFDIFNTYQSVIRITYDQYKNYINDGIIHFYMWILGASNFATIMVYYILFDKNKK